MVEQEHITRRGWDVIRLTSADLIVELVPDLGATVISVRRRLDDLELLHRTPWGLPAQGAPRLGGTAEVIRHDLNPGGWQSLYPNGGSTAVVNGADQGYDGEARVAPFEEVPTGDGEQGLSFAVRLRRSPTEMTKIIDLDGDTLTITERIRNVGSEELEVMWGSQLQLAAPLIGKDAEVDCAASIVHPDATLLYDASYDDVMPWPRTAGSESVINLRYLPEPGGAENRMAYLTEFDRGSVSVSNAAANCAISLEWDAELWPYLWYELEAGGTEDHPWFGTGYFLALTPNSSWPAHGLHDARRNTRSTLKLPAGEERSSTLTLRVGQS